jgi:hypothetical protein
VLPGAADVVQHGQQPRQHVGQRLLADGDPVPIDPLAVVGVLRRYPLQVSGPLGEFVGKPASAGRPSRAVPAGDACLLAGRAGGRSRSARLTGFARRGGPGAGLPARPGHRMPAWPGLTAALGLRAPGRPGRPGTGWGRTGLAATALASTGLAGLPDPPGYRVDPPEITDHRARVGLLR